MNDDISFTNKVSPTREHLEILGVCPVHCLKLKNPLRPMSGTNLLSSSWIRCSLSGIGGFRSSGIAGFFTMGLPFFLPQELNPFQLTMTPAPHHHIIYWWYLMMITTISTTLIYSLTVHPGRLTWNLQITHLERKIIFQTSMIMFHVNLPGCTPFPNPPKKGAIFSPIPWHPNSASEVRHINVSRPSRR